MSINHKKVGENPAPDARLNEPPNGDPRWTMVGDQWVLMNVRAETEDTSVSISRTEYDKLLRYKTVYLNLVQKIADSYVYINEDDC
jgi:hypothetical protein